MRVDDDGYESYKKLEGDSTEDLLKYLEFINNKPLYKDMMVVVMDDENELFGGTINDVLKEVHKIDL